MNKKKLTQKSAFFLSPKKIKLIKTKIPIVNQNSMLIKIISCSICGSDIKIYNNGSNRVKAPRILGHEIAGIIIKKGLKIKNFNIGDKVSIGADISKKHNLAFGHELDGGFSQYLLIPKKILSLAPIHKFKKKLSYDLACFAEPLACCLNGFQKSNVKKNKTIVIFGAGPIGIMLALLANYYKSKKIIIVETSSTRINFIKQKFPFIDHVINLNNFDFKKNIYNVTNNKGADYIFTANSNIDSHKKSFEIINKEGTINLFGGLNINYKKIKLQSNLIHYNELKVVGSHGSTKIQHKMALNLIESNKINLKKLITHKISLSKINDAFKIAVSQKGIKIIIKPHV